MNIQETIIEIENEIRKTPHNKATNAHIGRLKAKLAKLRVDFEARQTASGDKSGYFVKKSGDATVVLVGFPSVGKSTLLNKLTGANSKIGSYEFTTLEVIPGVLNYKGATIQVLDVPGLVKGAASGRGRGKEVLSVVRNSNLVLFILDVFQTHHYKVLIDELYDAGIRVDTLPPDVTIKRTDRGGVMINKTIDLDLSDDIIKIILGEYKIRNAHVLIRENITIDQLIDAILGNRSYVSSKIVINKIDLANEEQIEYCKNLYPDSTLISAHNEQNLESVKESVFDALEFIRIYLKPQGEAADMEEPLIVLKNISIGGICDTLHRDFRRKFRYALVWGTSAKHPGQRVGLDHKLHDRDIVSLIIQR